MGWIMELSQSISPERRSVSDAVVWIFQQAVQMSEYWVFSAMI